MTTVKQILDEKGHEYFTINPKDTVFKALELMAEKHIGCLMVIDDDGGLIGIFSERDYARKVALMGHTSKDSLVKDIMSTELYTVKPDMTTFDCMAVMTDRHVRHLPVLEHNKIAGILSIGDIVNQIIHEQDIHIKDLEKYITSSGYGHQ
ncbi:MAG: CBS domain-containing protein [Bacteroidales bacterium]|nr:CBS domain-containing protein [Bacteroidales bacterium]